MSRGLLDGSPEMAQGTTRGQRVFSGASSLSSYKTTGTQSHGGSTLVTLPHPNYCSKSPPLNTSVRLSCELIACNGGPHSSPRVLEEGDLLAFYPNYSDFWGGRDRTQTHFPHLDI